MIQIIGASHEMALLLFFACTEVALFLVFRIFKKRFDFFQGHNSKEKKMKCFKYPLKKF
jgi:hypothetical protein